MSNIVWKSTVYRVPLVFLFVYSIILLSKFSQRPSIRGSWNLPSRNETRAPGWLTTLKGQFGGDETRWKTATGWNSAFEHDMNQVAKSLTLDEAQSLCDIHDLSVFDERGSRKVYDLFLAGTELDMLEIRMNELALYVDYFVIVESSQTFTFHPKPLYFRENYHRFEKFGNKIIYRVIDFEGMEDNSTWERENIQRNALFDAVFPSLLGEKAANSKDVIIVSDLDEIPRPETVQMLRNCDFPERITIHSEFYYYSFQWKHEGNDWDHPQATFFQGLDNTIRPQDLRAGGGQRHFVNGSWHCSSCFSTVAEMKKKIESFSHTEYDHQRFKDPAQVVRRVRNGLDLFDRESQTYNRIENNQDLPKYLKDRQDKFPWLVDRDPPNANFIDYFGVEGKIEDMTDD